MNGVRAPIGVIGTGYVGLVTAVGFAELGSDVWCVDIDQAKVAQLRRGEIPIYEPGLAELLARNRERLHFSTSLEDAVANARLLFVCVGTPPTYAGDADLSAVLAVVEAMPDSAEHALVMKSTVPCGTGRTLMRMLDEAGKRELAYVSCPEFLKEGSAIDDFVHPDRVVVGEDGDGWAGAAVAELYAPVRAPLLRTDVASAEMIKLAANAFLATKISFINEIANVCEETGANVLEVARGVGLDGRIGPRFLSAGIGYGGSCFTKDVSALKLLAANSGYHFQLLGAVIEVNELQKRRVIAKLTRRLGELAGRRIGLLGLAFKPNTDDMRGASSLVLASRLEAEGALVRAYDPIASHEARRVMPDLDCGASVEDVLSGADAIVLVTEWPEFLALDWDAVATAMTGNVVIDGRNALDGAAVRAAGLIYEGIGIYERGAGMQAVILAGGEGTRLRPLTSRVAKPVVTLVDRPFIAYMLEWLHRHGVTEVVLACGFLADRVRAELGDGRRYGPSVRYVEEREPLGTGGALRHAADHLGDRFLVCNGDVLTDIDLGAQLAQHERTGAVATLALIEVEDPSAYGLVRCDGDGAVLEFIEKPQGPVDAEPLVSAGAYVLERSVLEMIEPGRAVSLEREIWPALIGAGLYGYVGSGYWLDIGTPERYLQGTFDIISGAVRTDHAHPPDAVVIGAGCEIAPDARIGPLAVLGPGVRVGEGAAIERSVVLAGAEIGPGCVLRDAIVAERAKIGANTELEAGVVIGEDAIIVGRARVEAGTRVEPGGRL